MEFVKRLSMDLGSYQREQVSCLAPMEQAFRPNQENDVSRCLSIFNEEEGDSDVLRQRRGLARACFDQGLMQMFAFHFEEAAKCFILCLKLEPNCALAHGLVALCHCPNYNFKGNPYYLSTNFLEEDVPATKEQKQDPKPVGKFPSQQIADYHSFMAVKKVEELRGTDSQISALEEKLLSAIRIRTCQPGLDTATAEATVEKAYSEALKQVYKEHMKDPEVAYLYADSLMVPKAWRLYDYPTGTAISPEVNEVQSILENALASYPEHAGLCHLYVHLSEMSADPSRALEACAPLRTLFPDAGHLIHMATHIDVLVGDYESCVHFNDLATKADQKTIKNSPDTSGRIAFFFGYIVHNYHMLLYGAILGGMEGKATECAKELLEHLDEKLFVDNPDLVAYLESYSAMEVHVMVRFGRWKAILSIPFPEDSNVMLCRTATLRYGRALAYSALGNVKKAREEADHFDKIRVCPEASNRILHNNTIASIFAAQAPMLRGEIAYREGDYKSAFELLREAVGLESNLVFDEPWGVMQPIRHALGGLLLEQGHISEAEQTFRSDLQLRPMNPWGTLGLIRCLEARLIDRKPTNSDAVETELKDLRLVLRKQRESPLSDFDLSHPCECCGVATISHIP